MDGAGCSPAPLLFCLKVICVTDSNEIMWIEQSMETIWALAKSYFEERGRGALGIALLEDEGKPAYFEQDWPHLQKEVKDEIKKYSPADEIVLVISQPDHSFNIYLIRKNPETGISAIQRVNSI